MIVNRKLAEHYWHGEDPIGKRLHVGTAADPNPWLTIIGEIPNVTQGGPEETQDHQEQYFQPLAQVNVNPGTKGRPAEITGNTMSVLVRTYLPPAAMETSLRAIFHSLDRQLAVDQLQSMSQAISVTEGPRIFNTAVITAFGVASVLLAILGVYSVLAFSVALRVQELAIRIAFRILQGRHPATDSHDRLPACHNRIRYRAAWRNPDHAIPALVVIRSQPS